MIRIIMKSIKLIIYPIKELTKELENNRSSIDNQNKNFYDMKKRKDGLQNDRKLVFQIRIIFYLAVQRLTELRLYFFICIFSR